MDKLISAINTIDYLIKFISSKIKNDIEDVDMHWDVIDPLRDAKKDILYFMENTHNYYTISSFLEEKVDESIDSFIKFRDLVENKKESIYQSINFGFTYDLIYHINDLEKIYNDNKNNLE